MPEGDDLSEDDFERYLEDDRDSDDGDGGVCDCSESGQGGDDGDCDVSDVGEGGNGGDCDGSDVGEGGDCGDCDGSDVGEEGDGGDSEDGDGNNSSDDDNISCLPEYSQHLGCTCDMTNKALIDFFQLFVTDSILESIVKQTNLFTQQYMESHELPHRSRVQQWV